jgi:hypothetical protein
MAVRAIPRLPLLALGALVFMALSGQEGGSPSPQSPLPRIEGWSFSEAPRTYLPASLFEYIDGAAENYLSYAFKQLVVGNYKNEKSSAALTVEVYDMGNDENAFGIYSSERYPESHFLPVGNQGYWEEGTLNFIVGSEYVKILCFDCGSSGEATMRIFAGEVEKRVHPRGSLPRALELFPRAGLIANSEKFVRLNVLGFGFLHDGYLASYKTDGQEFDLFIIQGRDEAEAADMEKQYLAAQTKNNAPVQPISSGYRIKDRYAQNVFLARAGRHLVGSMRIKEGAEETGLRYLNALLSAVKK